MLDHITRPGRRGQFRAGAALACLALLLPMSACGNDDDQKAADALSSSLRKGESFKVKKKEADCIGEQMVDEIGVKKLQEYKLLTKDLKVDNSVDGVKMSKGDGKKAAAAITDCADAEKLLEDAITQSAGASDPQLKKCVEDAFTEDVTEKFLAAQFSGDTKAAQDLVGKPMMECAQKAG